MTKEVSALRYVKATDLKVELAQPAELELDGDGFGAAKSFHARIIPGGLTIRVPADAE
jgi:diacylglycerol kinase family enzyme